MTQDDETDDEMVRTTIQMPRNIRDEAKNQTEHGELSEMVRDLFREVAFGEEINKREQYKKQLERVRDEKDEVRGEIRDLQSRLDTLEDKESRLEERLSESTSLKDKYDGMLEMLEQTLYSGTHVDKNHGAVERAANTAGVEPEDVIEDLKDRNPEVPDYAFVRKDRAELPWRGLSQPDGENSE